MIAGLTGAGKSTYAEKLRLELGAVRFSIDDWNARLFFPDQAPDADFDWFYERVQRSCAQMRAVADHLLAAGGVAVFDCGFTNAHERQIFYDWADAGGWPVTLHYLNVASDERWRRVEQRNGEKGATYALTVTRQMFDFMERIWEAPDADELAQRHGVVVDG